MPSPSKAQSAYSPLYFLASVGSGGLTVTFFMMLMFWVPHSGRPVPVFEDIAAAFATGALPLQAAIAVAVLGVAVFAALNLRYLVWNIGALNRFRRTPGFEKLSASNAQSALMAAPLAMAMSVNAGFILGLVFVPGLWGFVEYLFPLAMIAFVAIGIHAARIYGGFLARVLGKGGFACEANNSFAQMLPAFAFAMVSVGLAAPAAMSAAKGIAGLSLILSTFFAMTALVIALVVLILGLRAMMEHGVAPEAAPTLLILIPLMTVLGIAWMRQSHGLHVQFDSHTTPGGTLTTLTRLISIQLVFAAFGLTILRAQGYFGKFLRGEAASPGAYALVCPGVALNVLMFFWINKGLVATGLIAKFGTVYWGLTAVAIALQFAMVALVFFLNRQHFRARPRTALQHA